MKRFKNILVVYNDVPGADDALTQGAALAMENDARLTVVDICPIGYRSPEFIAEREKRLRRTVRCLHLEGVKDADAFVLIGDDYEEVIRQVVRAKHDMVIASSAGGSPLKNALYGSFAIALMRKCPGPVWIVKPGQSAVYRRVLAAVDIGIENSATDPLSAKIIEMASSLASGHDAEFHVLHAWDVTGKDADTLSSEVPDPTRVRLLDNHEAARRDVLQALLEKHVVGEVSPVAHLPRGTPIWEIAGAVDSREIDVVVMGTASRSGLAALFLGNAAETILEAARCGVMTVKPDGFEAPIALERDQEVA